MLFRSRLPEPDRLLLERAMKSFQLPVALRIAWAGWLVRRLPMAHPAVPPHGKFRPSNPFYSSHDLVSSANSVTAGPHPGDGSTKKAQPLGHHCGEYPWSTQPEHAGHRATETNPPSSKPAQTSEARWAPRWNLAQATAKAKITPEIPARKLQAQAMRPRPDRKSTRLNSSH